MGESVTLVGGGFTGQYVEQGIAAAEALLQLESSLGAETVTPSTSEGVTPLPEAVRVQDLTEEAEVQRNFARGLGAVAMGASVEAKPENPEERRTSILDRVRQAREGDRAPLEADVRLALVEAILEVGVNEVKLDFDADGHIVQHGHRLYDILENTIRLRPGDHPVLHETTRTEGLSLSTMKMLEKSGKLDDGYIWVVPRMVPVGVPARALRDYGYFENLAVSWGVVWKDSSDGQLVMRTLFTAGVTTEAHEEKSDRAMTDAELDQMIENRLTRRHDIDAVAKLYKKLGMPVPNDIAGFQRGFIMHKSHFVHEGEYDVDIAQLNDEQLGPEFYLGRHAPREDYQAHSRASIASMRNLDCKKDAVVSEMMAHVTPDMDEMTVARLMARLARTHAIDYVIDHPEVDAGPLGRAAAVMRDEYLQYVARGDMDRALQIREEIHRVARVNMCGFGGGEKDERDAADSEGGKSDKSKEEGESKNGIIRCVNCAKYVPKKDVVKKDSWQCPACKYEVDICNGEVLNSGEQKSIAEPSKKSARSIVKLFFEKDQVALEIPGRQKQR